VRGELYAHEIVSVPPGLAGEYLAMVRTEAEAAYGEHGLSLVGAFRTAMRADDECILLWACPSWAAWGAFEAAWAADGGLAGWSSDAIAFGATWQRTVLVDSELSPMRLGRQPAASDRRPLEEIR
jgi:hypothetical protein